MKTVFTAILIAFNGFFLTAQTDTLNSFYKSTGSTVVASPNGGYASGTNGYGDREKLQAFVPTQPYSVLGAIVWFAVKNELSAQPEQSNIWLKLRRHDITAQTTVPFIAGPKETIDSVSFSINNLQAGTSTELGYNYLPFNSPVLVSSPYGISVSFTEGMQAEDTLAIMHSADDSVIAVGQSWETWNGNWRRMIDNWGLNIDFAIFPVIDTTLNGLAAMPNLEFKVFPNPADKQVNISHDPILGGVQIEVLNTSGQRVMHLSEKQSITTTILDVSNLSKGIYFIKIISDDQYGVKPIVIVDADN